MDSSYKTEKHGTYNPRINHNRTTNIPKNLNPRNLITNWALKGMTSSTTSDNRIGIKH